MSEIKTVGVLGAGTMGNGIAHVFARSGFDVRLCEVEQRFLDRGLETIKKNLDREASKGKLTADEVSASLQRIQGTLDRQSLASCDFVIEAATEKFEIKSQLFVELDSILPKHVILASNTSSISITKLAAQTKRPEQVIGMHFFNPVPVMKLVEVIRGLATSQATYDMVKALAEIAGFPGRTRSEMRDIALLSPCQGDDVGAQIPLEYRVARAFGGDAESLLGEFERRFHLKALGDVFSDGELVGGISIGVANPGDHGRLPEQFAILAPAAHVAAPFPGAHA